MEAAEVELRWHAERDGVRVLVQQGEEAPKLWAASGAQGASTTGPWVNENVRFLFEDRDGARLGTVVLTAPDCR